MSTQSGKSFGPMQWFSTVTLVLLLVAVIAESSEPVDISPKNNEAWMMSKGWKQPSAGDTIQKPIPYQPDTQRVFQ